MDAEILKEERKGQRGDNLVLTLELTWEEARDGCRRTLRIEEREVVIQVPPRTRDGRSIWVAGQGARGATGSRPGDLSVRLSVGPPPDGWCEGDDDLTLTPSDLPATGERGDVSPDAILEIVERMATLPVVVDPAHELAEVAPAARPASPARQSSLTWVAAAAAIVCVIIGLAFAFRGHTSPAQAAPPAAVAMRICTDSGLPAGPGCPHTELKSFAPGTEPKGVCAQHQAVLVRVCKKSGLLASPQCPDSQVEARSFAAGTAPTTICRVHAKSASPAPPTTRFCGVCGAPQRPGAQFCGRCGHPL